MSVTDSDRSIRGNLQGRCMLRNGAFAVGFLLIALWSALQVRAEATRAAAVAGFQATIQEEADDLEIDFSLWAKGRIAAWEKHLGSDVGPTLGI